MNIYLIRHGQTKLNKLKLMQGLTDEPLSDKGRQQAKEAGKNIANVKFDAVFASPLDRAIETASLASGWDRKDIRVDERLIEVNFGKYEMKPYNRMGLKMSLYWALPEIFPAPEGVESIASIVERSSSFLKELEGKEYENVLIAAHGGILRGMNGYLRDRRNGIYWRPKMHNCEIMHYSSVDGRHELLEHFRLEK